MTKCHQTETVKGHVPRRISQNRNQHVELLLLLLCLSSCIHIHDQMSFCEYIRTSKGTNKKMGASAFNRKGRTAAGNSDTAALWRKEGDRGNSRVGLPIFVTLQKKKKKQGNRSRQQMSTRIDRQEYYR